jgi:DNA repair protein RadC
VPSCADIGITNKLRRGLLMIDVLLLDHVIIGETVYSFARGGRVDTP